MDHHVITERVLLVQHLAAHLAGVPLAVQYLVLVCHVAVLCRVPPVPPAKGAQPLFISVRFATDLCKMTITLWWLKPLRQMQRTGTWLAVTRYS